MKQSATITMSRPVLQRIRKIAKGEKRTLSQQIEMLVEKHFTAKTPASGNPTESNALA